MKRKDNLSKRSRGGIRLLWIWPRALGKKLDLASGNSSPELFSPLNRLSDYKILFVSLLWVEGWKARQMLAKAPLLVLYLRAFLMLFFSPAARTKRKQQTLLSGLRAGRFSHLLYVVGAAAGEWERK
jgi:hypothetical protein